MDDCYPGLLDEWQAVYSENQKYGKTESHTSREQENQKYGKTACHFAV